MLLDFDENLYTYGWKVALFDGEVVNIKFLFFFLLFAVRHSTLLRQVRDSTRSDATTKITPPTAYTSELV